MLISFRKKKVIFKSYYFIIIIIIIIFFNVYISSLLRSRNSFCR